MTDSPALEELWSCSDAGECLTEKESLVYRCCTVGLSHCLSQPQLFFSISVCLLFSFSILLFIVLISLFTHVLTHLYAQVFSFSVSPHLPHGSIQHDSLSTYHDQSLGWPPVLIRESVISSAQSLTTHPRNTV